ncbi:DUF2795 domain-containing protein [Dyella jiangningensis]|nr:DUF2795 domain-containing protein [Dyella jiangningensis]
MTRGLGGSSPANVQKYLHDVSYPTDKQTLIKQAERNGAPKEELDVVKQLKDEHYGGPQDVMKNYGEIE